MKRFIEAHKQVWNREFVVTVIIGAILLIASLVINYFATTYASERVSLPVTDLILSNIRVFDVDLIIIWGAVFLILFTVIVTLLHPKKIPFVLKSVALFVIIRSVFISLTHLGPFSPQVAIDQLRIFNYLGFGTSADLFFSGHTGLPFLLGLIYWDNKILRNVFFAISAILATSVLLGHLHYSIDVLAAFFITYTIFHLAQRFFAKDWKLANTLLE